MAEADCLGVGRAGGMRYVVCLRVGRAGGMEKAACLGVGRAGRMVEAGRLEVRRGGGMVEAGRLGVILSIGRESYLCEAITMRMICLRYSRFSGCDSSSSPMIISLFMYM